MATKYFKKLNLANTINGSDGKLIEFESIGDRDRTGVIALDETKTQLILDLEKFAEDRVGGVVVISPEIYEELKKKEPQQPQRLSPLSNLRVAAAPVPFKRGEVGAPPAAVAANAEPPPPSAASFFQRARTRRDTIT